METKGVDFYLGKIWGWVFPPAQVRQSPNCIPHHSQTVLFSQQPENENFTSLEHLLNSIDDLKQMAAWLTALKRVEYCSPGHSPCTQCCHLQYCLKPTPPAVEKDSFNHKISPISLYICISGSIFALSARRSPVPAHPRNPSRASQWKWAPPQPGWPRASGGMFLRRC